MNAMRTRLWTCGLLVMLLGLAAPRPSQAQGVLVQGLAAATESDGHTSPTFGGAVTYRFNRALGLGVELSHVRSFSDTEFPSIYCCEDKLGHATVFTTNVRLEIPTLSRTVIPFVVGGGGLASVTNYYGVVYAAANVAALIGANTVSPIYGGPSTLSSTTTTMALTLGGGASFLLTDHFAIDADLRALHLLGDRTRTVGRFGVGVSYRF
jgi:opacity protein-like surface antigen